MAQQNRKGRRPIRRINSELTREQREFLAALPEHARRKVEAQWGVLDSKHADAERKADRAQTPAEKKQAAAQVKGIESRKRSLFQRLFSSKRSKLRKAAKLSERASALASRARDLEQSARKPKLRKRAKKGIHRATSWLLNGQGQKKNSTVNIKSKRTVVIARAANGKRPLPNYEKSRRRRNLDHPDSQHQVRVHQHWRSGGASQWQRAARAGQRDLFAHGIKVRNGKQPRRRNTEASAAELYELFQGREPSRELRAEGDSSMPATQAVLGLLKEIKLEGGKKITFTRLDGVYLTAAKVRGHDRLFIVGRYEVERPAGITVPIHVGRVESLTYETRKEHIGDGRAYEFVHRLAEEGGTPPMLTIDPSGKLHFTGGSYFLTREGIRD